MNSLHNASSLIEKFVWDVVAGIGHHHGWTVVTHAGDGRDKNWARDRRMAAGVDHMLAFFQSDSVTGGTAHALDCAIDAGISAEAWSTDGPTLIASVDRDGGHLRDGWEKTRRLAEHIMAFKAKADQMAGTPTPQP